jgi:arylsulfatase
MSEWGRGSGGSGLDVRRLSEFFGREAWRFVVAQQEVVKLAMTAVEFPPMQDPASFNLDAVKRQIEALRARAGQ